jgi:hypothetical protein
MVLCMSLLIAGNGVTADLPTPPNGYSWVECKETKVALLKPANWFFKKEESNGTWGYFISKEEIKDGQDFNTGLTINVISQVTKLTGVTPSKYAKAMLERLIDGKKIKKEPQQQQLDVLTAYMAQIVDKKPGGSYVAIHYLLIGNDTTGTLYLVIFESPLESWDTAWKVATPMLNMLKLDTEL